MKEGSWDSLEKSQLQQLKEEFQSANEVLVSKFQVLKNNQEFKDSNSGTPKANIRNQEYNLQPNHNQIKCQPINSKSNNKLPKINGEGNNESVEDPESRRQEERGEWIYFVYIDKEKTRKVYYTQRSLNMIGLNNTFRYKMIQLIEWNRFDQFIIFIIILNSIFIGLVDYTNPTSDTLGNKIAQQSEPVFACIFAIECVIKVVAMGLFFSKKCYLRDAWNWLDLIVVVIAIVSIFPNSGSIQGLRTFRLLRPLRNLSALSQMKVLINTLLSSLIQFVNILILAFFLCGVFSILGINLFAGLTHQRCRTTPAPVNGTWPLVPNDNRLCGGYHQCNIACGSLYDYNKSVLYGIHDFNKETRIQSLNWGLTNFDYLSNGILTIFQCITKEGWTNMVYMIGDAYNYIIAAIFFALIIIICSYFLLNLTIAVMLEQFACMQGTQDKVLSQYQQHFGIEGKGIMSRKKQFAEAKTSHVSSPPTNGPFLKRLYAELIFKPVEVPNSPYYDKKITRICFRIVSYQWFQNMIYLMIVINTVIICFEKYPLYESIEWNIISLANTVFVCCFLLEKIIEAIGLGVSKCIFQSKKNVIDFIIVMASTVQLGFNFKWNTMGASLSVMRLMKLVIIPQVLKKWPSF